jgi:NAD(P)-dependent dehydrogenase (short-subunit alcohol dehydrogenase family)
MKRVIITGGSDGLGLAFVKLCLKQQIQVINLSRHQPNIEDIYIDNQCIHLETDLADEKSIIATANRIKENYPQFDAIIHCAAAISLQEPNKITYDELENLMKVNTLAPIFLTSQLFDLIKENEADIMNVGSTVGAKAYKNQCAYGTSKRAMRGINLNLQTELANTKSRVIGFNP